MRRRCPRCSYPLEVVSGDRRDVERCGRCSGTFLDRSNTKEELGELADPEHWINSYVAHPVKAPALSCACGHGSMRRYRLALGSSQVEVDHCPGCQGLWLDRGEGQTLRSIVEQEDAARLVANTDAGGVKTYLFQLFTGLPREVYNPVQRRPWLLYAVVAALVAIFWGQSQLPRETWIQLALVPSRLWQGQQVWTLLSYALLHAGILHLVGNLYFLWIFGDNVEDRIGRRGLLAVLLVAAVVGGGTEAAFDVNSGIPILGASGAVAGSMGAYLKLFPRVRLWVVFFFVRFKIHVAVYLGLWVGIQLLSASLGWPGVAWYAHVGGFASGYLLAHLLPTRKRC